MLIKLSLFEMAFFILKDFNETITLYISFKIHGNSEQSNSTDTS